MPAVLCCPLSVPRIYPELDKSVLSELIGFEKRKGDRRV